MPSRQDISLTRDLVEAAEALKQIAEEGEADIERLLAAG
jgi:hypothetical protein